MERAVFAAVASGGKYVASHIVFARDAPDSAPFRSLQHSGRPGVGVNIEYTIHCGATCERDEVVDLNPNTIAGQDNALALAAAIHQVAQDTAVDLGFDTSAVMSDPEIVAATMVNPAPAVVYMPGNYMPDVDCLGVWTPCTAACTPRVFVVHATPGANGAECAAEDGMMEPCEMGMGECGYDYDCVGSWGECIPPGTPGTPCSDKRYTITLPLSGTGAACPFEDGSTLPCSAGEGTCPADIDCQGSWESCEANGPSGNCPDKHFITTVPAQGMGLECQDAMIEHIISGNSYMVYTDTMSCDPGDGLCTCPDGTLDC